MKFDFEAALKQSAADTRSASLEAIILGPSGAGKSFALGTLKVPTLYLYASGETHGVKAAQIRGGGLVTPYCFDRDPITGDSLSADDSLEQLQAVLGSLGFLKEKGFKAIVLDGASEVEFLIRQCGAYSRLCTTDKGKHNSFAEASATLTCFRPFITALQNAQRALGIHYVVTCIADVKEMGVNGEYMECSAALKGYSVAAGLVQQFHDVLVVGKMVNPKSGKPAHRFQFGTEITKTAKEESGAIKRTLNFNPRINGYAVEELPGHMEADLSLVIKMKEAKFCQPTLKP